jgi:hypothetical protein
MSPNVKKVLVVAGLAAIVGGSAVTGASADSATHYYGRPPAPASATHYFGKPTGPHVLALGTSSLYYHC